MTPVQIGLIVGACLIAAGIFIPWGKLRGGGGMKLDDAAIKMAAMVKHVETDLVLSLPGRQALVDVAMFYQKPIELYPPSAKVDAAMLGRAAIIELLRDAPPAQPIAPVTPPAPAVT